MNSTWRMTRTSAPTGSASSWCAGARGSRNSTSILRPASATRSSTPWLAWSCSSSDAYRGAGRPWPSVPSSFACCAPTGGASTVSTSRRCAACPRPRESPAPRAFRAVVAVRGGAGGGRAAAHGLRTVQPVAPGDPLSRGPDAAVAARDTALRRGTGPLLWRGLFRCRHLVAVHFDPRPWARAGVAEPDAGAAGGGLHGKLLGAAGLVCGALPARRGPLAPLRRPARGVAADRVAARLGPVGLSLAVPRLLADRYLARCLRARRGRLWPLRAAAASGRGTAGAVASARARAPGPAGAGRARLGRRLAAGAFSLAAAPRCAGAGGRPPGCDPAGREMAAE